MPPSFGLTAVKLFMLLEHSFSGINSPRDWAVGIYYVMPMTDRVYVQQKIRPAINQLSPPAMHHIAHAPLNLLLASEQGMF